MNYSEKYFGKILNDLEYIDIESFFIEEKEMQQKQLKHTLTNIFTIFGNNYEKSFYYISFNCCGKSIVFARGYYC
jgi:hypothetical protein